MASKKGKPGPRGEPTIEDDEGIPFKILSAFIQLKEAKLHLADHQRCADLVDKLEGPTECNGRKDDKILVVGPTVADLVRGTTEPSWESVRVPATHYKKVAIELTQKADLLGGASLVAEASFDRPDGGGSRRPSTRRSGCRAPP